jgi:hypothetical protein
MKPEFRNASDSFRRINPHLFTQVTHDIEALAAAGDKSAAFKKLCSQPGKPLRQRTKQPSRAELEFIALLEARFPENMILHEKIAFRLANGVTYWPDVIVVHPRLSFVKAYEVKGKRRKDSAWARDDSRVKLKMAPTAYPWIQWALVWKDEAGNWQEQVITA